MNTIKKLDIDPGAKALIFDLDGTLADTLPLHFWVFKNILLDFGIDFTPEQFDTLAGIPAIEIVRKLNEKYGTEMEPQVVGNYKEREYEKIMYKMKLVEPVVELVKRYYGRIPMALGTGGYKRLSWKSLEILGLDKNFKILVSAEDIKNPKPHPDTFLKCAELMGVEPEVCQVFEDGNPGIQAARAAGMMSTLVTDFYKVAIGKEI